MPQFTFRPITIEDLRLIALWLDHAGEPIWMDPYLEDAGLEESVLKGSQGCAGHAAELDGRRHPVLRVSVAADNTPARRLYASCGFRTAAGPAAAPKRTHPLFAYKKPPLSRRFHLGPMRPQGAVSPLKPG
jgi:hypothetical protein